MMNPGQLLITPTDDFAVVNGFQVRVWKGLTSDGTECLALVAAVGLRDPDRSPELEPRLIPIRPRILAEDGR